MEFDNSWQGVTVPGDGTSYFEKHRGLPFDVGSTRYSAINAWWLSEISRLIYRHGATRKLLKDRRQLLAEVGFIEREPFDVEGTQGSIIESAPGSIHPPMGILAFRGSEEFKDWMTNINAVPVPWEGPGLVHSGFRRGLNVVWEQIESLLTTMTVPLFYTGHSLGAALATVAAARKPPRATYTYGGPRCGDAHFASTFETRQHYRIVNNRDIVATLPPPPLYRHAGEQHYVSSAGSMLVNPSLAVVDTDRLRTDPTYDDHRLLLQAPQFIADHAPVNYVAHLERMVGGEVVVAARAAANVGPAL
ncbi:MAG TPA: lipase family protein [Thermoanaerobaculia bacterium]|jgi:hypothetical protein|nr:lipase family protein [Thermoanaerobaculia bacterium]